MVSQRPGRLIGKWHDSARVTATPNTIGVLLVRKKGRVSIEGQLVASVTPRPPSLNNNYNYVNYIFFPLSPLLKLLIVVGRILANPNHEPPGHAHCSVFQVIILLGAQQGRIGWVTMMGAGNTLHGPPAGGLRVSSGASGPQVERPCCAVCRGTWVCHGWIWSLDAGKTQLGLFQVRESLNLPHKNRKLTGRSHRLEQGKDFKSSSFLPLLSYGQRRLSVEAPPSLYMLLFSLSTIPVSS